MLRFTRYLHQQSIRCLVVSATPPKATSIPLDRALLGEIPPQVEVTRVASFEPECFVNSWTHPWDKVRRNLFKTFAGLLVPDDQALWIEPAARVAARLARSHQALAILATGPPFSSLIAGARAARRAGVPLVVDFRDDWTGIRRLQGRYSEGRQRKEEALEQSVLQQSQAILTVTPTLVQQIGQRSGHPERVKLLYNGFDPEHFPNPAQGFGDGSVFYAGSLYQKREPDGFFQAWQRFRQSSPLSALRFELAGPVADDCRHYFEPARADCAWLGFQPHQEVRRRLQQASLNLAWLDPGLSAQAYTGKLLEYLGAQRPVLMLGPVESDAARLLQRSGLGLTLECGDVEGILSVLRRVEEGGWNLQPNLEVIRPFDARQQVAELAAILRQPGG